MYTLTRILDSVEAAFEKRPITSGILLLTAFFVGAAILAP